jgi:2-aminoadipate transaminase
VELCARHDVPIVEDDPYGQLRYAGSHLPALVRLDLELRGLDGGRAFGGNVIYLGTMSKTLAPGLRVGWVVAPREVALRLVQMKQAADLHSSTFAQMVAFETARGGFLDRHVREARRVYGQRRDAMLAALDRHFPPGVKWTRPEGGLFLWVSVPETLDTQALLKDALKAQVAFVPGAAFHPAGGGAHTLRLNFSYCRPEVIEEGVRRLGLVLASALSGVGTKCEEEPWRP